MYFTACNSYLQLSNAMKKGEFGMPGYGSFKCPIILTWFANRSELCKLNDCIPVSRLS